MAEKKKRTQAEMNRLRELAEDMFIRLAKTGQQIASELDVSAQSVSKWRTDGNWDKRKRDAELTPVRLKELLMEEARKLVSGIATNIEADKLSKVMKAIEQLDKSVNPRVALTVFEMFDNFMADTNPAMAIQFTEYHKMFLQHLIAQDTL